MVQMLLLITAFLFFRPIKLVVAKCWEQAPTKGYLSMPSNQPVRPIDPGAWVAHTAAVRGTLAVFETDKVILFFSACSLDAWEKVHCICMIFIHIHCSTFVPITHAIGQ